MGSSCLYSGNSGCISKVILLKCFVVGDRSPRRLAAGRSLGSPGPVLLQHRAGRVAVPEQVVRPWGFRRNEGRAHGRPPLRHGGAVTATACGAVTAKLDTRRVSPWARALPDPGLAGFIRPLWITGSASQGLWEARHIAAGNLGPPSCGSWRSSGSRPLAAGRSTTWWQPAESPDLAPDPSRTAILSTGSCRILGGVSPYSHSRPGLRLLVRVGPGRCILR